MLMVMLMVMLVSSEANADLFWGALEVMELRPPFPPRIL